jgi:hypothetical protein
LIRKLPDDGEQHPGDQTQQRGFPGAALADNHRLFALLQRHVDALQGRLTARISKRDILKLPD